MVGHSTIATGTITKYYPEAENGFITTEDGEVVYFARNDIKRSDFSIREGRTVTFRKQAQVGLKPRAREIDIVG